MARKVGQIVRRGPCTWLVRVYNGRALRRRSVGNGTLSARDRERLGETGDYLTCLSAALGDLQQEIAKCILICANCHRKLHAHLKRGGECAFWEWDLSMVKDAAEKVAAARRGIQRRKERGIPEPTHDYGIEEDAQRKHRDLLSNMQREIARREAEGDFVITAYTGRDRAVSDGDPRN